MARGLKVGVAGGIGLGALAIVMVAMGREPRSTDEPAPTRPAAPSFEDLAPPPAAVSEGAPPVAQPVGLGAPAPLDCGRPAGAVARVARRVIEAGALCEALDAAVGEDPAARQAQGPAVLERLIEHALIRAELEARDLEVSTQEVDAALTGRGVTSPSPYERDAVEASLALSRLAQGVASPGRAELEAEYRQAPERWAHPGSARVDGLLARGPAQDPARLSEAEQRARRAAGALAAGADLDEVARREGLEPLTSWALESSGLEPELEAAVFSARGVAGAWLGPTRTRVGWVVARASGVTMPSPRTFEEAEADLRRAHLARHAQRAGRELLERLRRDAQIERLVIW